MKKILLIIIIVQLIFTGGLIGCSEKMYSNNASFKNVNAKIQNTGALAVDGCDYTVVIDTVSYHPDNLAADFTVNNLEVTLSANLTTTRFACGNARNNPGLQVIHIVSIARK